MRILGIKPLGVLAAALSIYAVGFVIYGLLFDAQWMAWNGRTAADFAGHEWRMALSWVMPVMLAIGIGWVMVRTGQTGLVAGAKTGLMLAVFLLVATRLYIYVYGIEPVQLLALDSAHLLLNGLLAGAVLGAMKATVPA